MLMVQNDDEVVTQNQKYFLIYQMLYVFVNLTSQYALGMDHKVKEFHWNLWHFFRESPS